MYCCSPMSNDSKSYFKGCTVKNITLHREKALMKLKNAVIDDVPTELPLKTFLNKKSYYI